MSHPTTTTDARRPAVPVPGGTTDRRGSAVAAVSGLVLVVLGLVATVPEGPPVGQASADRIRAFVGGDEVGLRIGLTGGLLVAVALVVFTAALAGRIRAVRPGSALAGTVAGAGLLLAVVQLLDVAAVGTPLLLPELIDTSLAEVDDAVLRGWYGLTAFTHFLAVLQMTPVAMVILGVSIAALRLGLLPRWLGWGGTVIGTAAALGVVAVMVGVSPLYPLWFVGLYGWWLWTLAVSGCAAVRLWRASRPA
ncbi:hypothetical protein [Geodermatophilus sp. URMC 64]